MKTISWAGVLIALGAAVTTYGHFCDDHSAAVVASFGALLAAVGQSLLSKDDTKKPPTAE